MKIQTVPIEKVVPYERNARQIPPKAVKKVAESLRQFGWKQPIVVDQDFVIIAGHTRLAAAQKLRMKEVPVLVAADLSPEKVKAYRLADNRTAQESSWDKDVLAIEVRDLQEMGFDLELAGFDPSDLVDLFGGGGGGSGEGEGDGKPKVCPTCGQEVE